jgi:hypothetical protein
MSEEKNMEESQQSADRSLEEIHENETANIGSLISNFGGFLCNDITRQRLKKALLSE